MNGPSDKACDDKAFEEYLQRGSAVSQQYRALESEDVPAEIEAAVLARASDAVREPAATKRKILRRWSVPVALAASTVLAISIVLESGTRHEVALTSAPQSTEQYAPQSTQADEDLTLREQAPAAQQREAIPQSAAARARSSEMEARDDAAHAREARAIEPRVPVRTEPDSASAQLADTSIAHGTAPAIESNVDEQAKAVEREFAREAPTHGASQAIAQTSAARPPPMAPQAVSEAPSEKLERAALRARALEDIPKPANLRESPDKWLEYIRKLRDAGEVERADREWREFRAAFPDYQVADDDRALPSR